MGFWSRLFGQAGSLAGEPDAPTATTVLRLAEEMIRSGNLDGGVPPLEELLQQMPEGWQPLCETEREVSVASWDAEEFRDWVEAHREGGRRIITWDGLSFSKIHYLLACAAVERGELEAAHAHIEHALELEPDHPLLHCQRGALLRRQGQLSGALQAYQRGVATPSWFRTRGLALLGMGSCLIDLGELGEAERIFRACLNVEPDHPQAAAELAAIEELRAHAPGSEGFEAVMAGRRGALAEPVGNAAVELVAESPGCYHLAVDELHVYWTANHGVMRRLKSSGAVETIADCMLLADLIALSSTHVYFTELGADLVAVPKNGGPRQVLATGQDKITGLAADDRRVYWSREREREGSLLAVATEGGAVEVLASAGGVIFFTLDDAYVYWTSHDEGSVTKLRKGGGAPLTLASGRQRPGPIVVDATHAFWIEGYPWRQHSARSLVVGVPKAGGAAVELTPDGTTIHHLAVDGARLYWSTGGELGTVSKSGGALLTLAERQWVQDLQVNGQTLYWTNNDLRADVDSVRRLTRPASSP